MESKEQVARTVRDFVLHPLVSSRPTIPTQDDNIDHIFRDLAKAFNKATSSKGHVKFLTAVDDIFTAYRAECAETHRIPEKTELTYLAGSFSKMTKGRISKEQISQARSIFGRFLCYRDQDESARRKRQNGEEYEGLTTDCHCTGTVQTPCEFFACLNVAEMEFISGFGNIYDDIAEPCIGFVIDTTGSMQVEIEAARSVVLQFMRSQADATTCYLLVPFNDNAGSRALHNLEVYQQGAHYNVK